MKEDDIHIFQFKISEARKAQERYAHGLSCILAPTESFAAKIKNGMQFECVINDNSNFAMLGKKTFLNISRKECLTVYKDVLKNSKKKWELGRKMAEAEEYGAAISFLIVSTEELVKAIILSFDGNGFEFRSMKGVDKFFKDHETKYASAFFLFAMSYAGNLLKKFVIKVDRGEIDVEKKLEEYKQDESIVWERNKFWIFKRILELKRELKWFSEIDKLRQDGIYCDYHGKMKTPLALTKEDYMNVYDKLDAARMVGRTLIKLKPSTDMTGNFEELKRIFKEKKVYEEFSIVLQSLGKNDKSPFEKLGRTFTISRSNESSV